jgi:hypothetical protein
LIVVVAAGATKDGVDLQLKVLAGMKVSGRLAVLPMPRATPATFRGSTSSTGSKVPRDGAFSFHLPESEHTIIFDGLPAGSTVKSIVYVASAR